jgi:hypothetical protein
VEEKRTKHTGLAKLRTETCHHSVFYTIA